MGIGTAIAAAATIGGSLIGNSSSRAAAETVSDSTDRQIELQQQVYNDTVARNDPFYQTGVQANNQLSQLLGLGGPQQQGQPQFQQLQQQPPQQGTTSNPALAAQNAERARAFLGGQGVPQGGRNTNIFALQGGQGPQGVQGGQLQGQQLGQPQPQQLTSNGRPIVQNGALTELQNSPGYQFRLQEGVNALDNSAAARGGLLSGGHIRQATRYAQDYASGEYANRVAQLQGVQGAGQAAANSSANAGAGFASNASNALANNASFAANQQQQRGNTTAGLIGNIGGLIGGAI